MNNTDLTLARRVVFFAKGDETGGQVLYLAAGKDIRNMSTPIDGIDGNYFPSKAFGIMTKGVNLTNHWKRYEIGPYNGFRTGITYPFGFVITSKNSTATQKFFLKGVSFDDKYPVNGLSTDSITFKD